MGIIAGDMRYKINVIAPTVTRNEYGEEIESWIIVHTLRAAKKSLGGSKTIDNNEIFTTNSLEFTTHYRYNITEKMRIELGSDTYLINNIAEIGFREGLKITVEKINE